MPWESDGTGHHAVGCDALDSGTLRAGVTQLAECLLPKQNVEGSSPFSRSIPLLVSTPVGQQHLAITYTEPQASQYRVRAKSMTVRASATPAMIVQSRTPSDQ